MFCPFFEPLMPLAKRSEAKVYGRSRAGIVGSKTARRMDVCLL
jgi:hypothetical protein